MNAIWVDVGGTKIATAVVSAEGEILSEVRTRAGSWVT
jgi:predicted NBD/HSP70 family sugar kinase